MQQSLYVFTFLKPIGNTLKSICLNYAIVKFGLIIFRAMIKLNGAFYT